MSHAAVDGPWYFGSEPGKYMLWFGPKKGSLFQHIGMDYKQRGLIKRGNRDRSVPFDAEKRFDKEHERYSIHYCVEQLSKFEALHHAYNAWRDARECPLTERLWYGTKHGSKFGELYPLHWEKYKKDGREEDQWGMEEIASRYRNREQALRSHGKGRPGEIVNYCGREITSSDDKTPASQPSEYISDDGFCIPSNATANESSAHSQSAGRGPVDEDVISTLPEGLSSRSQSADPSPVGTPREPLGNVSVNVARSAPRRRRRKLIQKARITGFLSSSERGLPSSQHSPLFSNVNTSFIVPNLPASSPSEQGPFKVPNLASSSPASVSTPEEKPLPPPKRQRTLDAWLVRGEA